MSQSKQAIFQTNFGLLLHFPNLNTTNLAEEKEKINNFFELLNEQKIPYSLVEEQKFSLTIAEHLTTLSDVNNLNNSSDSDFPEISKNSSAISNLNQQNEYIHSKNQSQTKSVQDNILFFSGFTREQVEDFLEKIRNNKYPGFPLKAAATKHNHKFTFHQLINELTQDRIVISHVINLRKRINFAQQFLTENDSINNENRKIIEEEINKSEILLANVETHFDLQEFRKQIHNFNEIFSKLKN